MQRREFVKLAGATVLCACTGGIGAIGCASGTSNVPPAPQGSYRRQGGLIIVSLRAVDQLNATGNAVRLVLEDRTAGEESETRILVAHLEGGAYRAYADRCTHRGRELNYRHEERRLECVSGKAHFDLVGHVIGGPAESALLVYPCRREGEDLVIEV